ncbi:type II toxin-antitoxin system HigB family toxin [Acidithiobacillus ferrivorans]|uniref:type II toxin-antitoxin system HigB family toxin n=1 Tax=Acidithiobacillus ferrivorans TaxID=160808 RepID=UPI0008DC2902
MRVIALKILRTFWEKHRDAEPPLRAWHTVARQGSFPDFATLKATFGSADMAGIYTVFDIGGNKYRLVAHIHHNTQRLYVRWILTHKEYDQWTQQLRQGKV